MGVYERNLPKMATWAQNEMATLSTTGKRLFVQRLWMGFCLVMSSTFSADAMSIGRGGYSDTIVFSSNAGAAKYVGGTLGEFVRTGELNGRPYYKQRDTEGKVDIFLYSDGGKWLVSDIGDGRHLQNHLLNNQDTDLPPRTNWLFAKEGQQWSNNDWSLKLEFTPLVLPCNLVRVSGGSRVWTDHWSKMGNYRLQQGRWSEGRPVYKRGSGSTALFLFVPEGKTAWSINDSMSPTGGWIQSGRATNSPTSSRAGGGSRKGVTRWRYAPGWWEGDIRVS